MPAAFGLVVNDRGEILMIQRGYGEEKGKWSLPGGNRDKGEGLSETARRETQEETGIRMSIDNLYAKGNAANGRSRRDAAIRETRFATGIEFVPERLYYENRHQAQIWLGRPRQPLPHPTRVRWFSHDRLPDDDSLGFAIDVRTMDRWAAENDGSSRISYA